MDKEIRVYLVGLGNCASALIQGISFYKLNTGARGLMNREIDGYESRNISIVGAFDIDRRKVGKKIKDAIWCEPNNTKRITENIIGCDYPVKMGRALDGLAAHMAAYPESRRFIMSQETEPTKDQVIAELRSSKADVLVNFLPVGSEQATRFYMECALEAKVGVVNCIPVFIGSDPDWAQRFIDAGLPIVGDDVKSQVGATIVHRTLAALFRERGVEVTRSYQLNVGGNSDFLNMLDRKRLASKKVSKTEAVTSSIRGSIEESALHVGPSDFVPWLQDNKLAFIRLEGNIFGEIPINLELRLSVEDSPNSAGVVIDAIRYCKSALDKGTAGPLNGPSAYLMKHPPVQMDEHIARESIELFLEGEKL
jgi:myo-inositol-1-phosphate synthase